jgi:hypothetical protein
MEDEARMHGGWCTAAKNGDTNECGVEVAEKAPVCAAARLRLLTAQMRRVGALKLSCATAGVSRRLGLVPQTALPCPTDSRRISPLLLAGTAWLRATSGSLPHTARPNNNW